jgi:hypothetical protein
MNPVPDMIDGAAVLWFTPIDERHRHTGYCQHFVGGSLLGAASGLAICQYGNNGEFYLFYCDTNWNALSDTCHESLERAQGQAEAEYEGSSETWSKGTTD